MNLEWIYGDIDTNYKFGFLLFFIIWTVLLVLAILYVIYKLKNTRVFNFRITKYGKLLNILILIFCYIIVFLQVRAIVLYTGLAYENFDINADLVGPFFRYKQGDYNANTCNDHAAYKLMMKGNARLQQAQDIINASQDITTINASIVKLNQQIQKTYDKLTSQINTAIAQVPK